MVICNVVELPELHEYFLHIALRLLEHHHVVGECGEVPVNGILFTVNA
jgi:hypothetical protein